MSFFGRQSVTPTHHPYAIYMHGLLKHKSVDENGHVQRGRAGKSMYVVYHSKGISMYANETDYIKDRKPHRILVHNEQDQDNDEQPTHGHGHARRQSATEIRIRGGSQIVIGPYHPSHTSQDSPTRVRPHTVAHTRAISHAPIHSNERVAAPPASYYEQYIEIRYGTEVWICKAPSTESARAWIASYVPPFEMPPAIENTTLSEPTSQVRSADESTYASQTAPTTPRESSAPPPYLTTTIFPPTRPASLTTGSITQYNTIKRLPPPIPTDLYSSPTSSTSTLSSGMQHSVSPGGAGGGAAAGPPPEALKSLDAFFADPNGFLSSYGVSEVLTDPWTSTSDPSPSIVGRKTPPPIPIPSPTHRLTTITPSPTSSPIHQLTVKSFLASVPNEDGTPSQRTHRMPPPPPPHPPPAPLPRQRAATAMATVVASMNNLSRSPTHPIPRPITIPSHSTLSSPLHATSRRIPSVAVTDHRPIDACMDWFDLSKEVDKPRITYYQLGPKRATLDHLFQLALSVALYKHRPDIKFRASFFPHPPSTATSRRASDDGEPPPPLHPPPLPRISVSVDGMESKQPSFKGSRQPPPIPRPPSSSVLTPLDEETVIISGPPSPDIVSVDSPSNYHLLTPNGARRSVDSSTSTSHHPSRSSRRSWDFDATPNPQILATYLLFFPCFMTSQQLLTRIIDMYRTTIPHHSVSHLTTQLTSLASTTTANEEQASLLLDMWLSFLPSSPSSPSSTNSSTPNGTPTTPSDISLYFSPTTSPSRSILYSRLSIMYFLIEWMTWMWTDYTSIQAELHAFIHFLVHTNHEYRASSILPMNGMKSIIRRTSYNITSSSRTKTSMMTLRRSTSPFVSMISPQEIGGDDQPIQHSEEAKNDDEPELDDAEMRTIWETVDQRVENIMLEAEKLCLRQETLPDQWSRAEQREINFLRKFAACPFIVDMAKTSSKQIAIEMTLVDSRAFHRIHPREFIGTSWKKGNHALFPATQLTRMIDVFNQRSYWVATEILLATTLEERITMLIKMIRLAHHVHLHHNYYATFAILNGLSLAPVHRLREEWNGLNDKYKDMYQHLRQTLVVGKQTEIHYRDHFREHIMEPQIPHLAFVLKDLYQLEDIPAHDTDSVFLNWHKYSKQWLSVTDILHAQHIDYEHLVSEPNAKLMLHMGLTTRVASENQLWERSYQICKKQQT